MKMLSLKTPASPEVERWQYFLIGRGYKITANGSFDVETERATKKYQKSRGLFADGVVGNMTLNAATSDGFALFEVYADSVNKKSQYWPPRPDLKSLTNAERQKLFGKFEFEARPTRGNPEAVKIDPQWVRENIVTVDVAALGLQGDVHLPSKVRLHRLAAEPFVQLIKTWSDKGMLYAIQEWNGSFGARFKRGRAEQGDLSNHSWGTAFDINANFNALGAIPALFGEEGCVRELVVDANKQGWYWGGHYKNRLDGMHFELVKV